MGTFHSPTIVSTFRLLTCLPVDALGNWQLTISLFTQDTRQASEGVQKW